MTDFSSSWRMTNRRLFWTFICLKKSATGLDCLTLPKKVILRKVLLVLLWCSMFLQIASLQNEVLQSACQWWKYCTLRDLQVGCQSYGCQLHQLGPRRGRRGHGWAEWRNSGELCVQEPLPPPRLVRLQLRGHGGGHHALLRTVPARRGASAHTFDNCR